METALPPVLVTASSAEVARTLAELMGDDYGAEVAEVDDGRATVSIAPIDDRRRSVVLYRVIQASRTVVERHPDSSLFLHTEEGSAWRLPPPAL